MMKYKNIVWDWNGTLLNDRSASVETLNRILDKKNLRRISEEMYREIFGFPVKAYYESLGFDFSKDDWGEVSKDYVCIYESLTGKLELNEGVREILPVVQEQGISHYVLSALKEDLLQAMLERFEIRPYFRGVCGSDNIYADGKTARGRNMLETYPILPGETLMIGDTLHDAEVAEALGFDCLLYAGGHNSANRLNRKGRVVHELGELLPFLHESGKE